MINYQDVLKKILLKDEEKFFHGLSFYYNKFDSITCCFIF